LFIIDTAEAYCAVKDFEGQRDDEISFTTGDVLDVLDKKKDGWWIVT